MRPSLPFVVAGVLFVALILTALLTGDAVWAIPIVILAVIVLGWFALARTMAARTMARHGGDPAAAVSDSEDGGLPKTHLISDDDTALGDTSQAHDEINPHDIPKGAPERQAAERLAAENDKGTGPVRDEGPGRIRGEGAGPVRGE
jgi:hypothetical protein